MSTELIMFAGCETSNPYAGVLNKEIADHASFDINDFMGTDNEPKVNLPGLTIYYGAGDTTYIEGDFSAISDLVGLVSGKYIYVHITGFTGDNAGVAGYFPVLSITGTTSITIGNTSLAGDTLIAFTDDEVACLIGGACDDGGGTSTVIETADDTITNDIDLTDGYDVYIYYNSGDTLTDDTSLTANGAVNGKIYLEGRGDSFEEVTDKADYPVITGAHAKGFTISGNNWDTSRIKLVNSGSFDSAITFHSYGGLIHHCWVVLTAAARSYYGIDLKYATAAYNYIDVDGSSGTYGYGIHMPSGRSAAIGNYITTGCGGINMYPTYACSIVCGNIIVEDGGSGDGIFVSGADHNEGCLIESNYIYGFTKSVNFESMPDAGGSGFTLVSNNVIWGDDDGSSFGICTNDTETHTVNVYHNFIGHVNTASELRDDDTIALTADPFTNAATGDFTLNDTAGGGADVSGAFLPTSWKLNEQDNWSQGIMQAEPSTGGGGGVNLLQGLLS